MADMIGAEDQIFRVHVGDGPLIATAIRDGGEVREEVAAELALDKPARLREEDPFTAKWTEVAPTRVVGTRSRFEVDLNRAREMAVYRSPQDAWGLKVWKSNPPEGLFERSLAEYDGFYRAMRKLLGDIEGRHGRFVVYDVHSYNHRQRGLGACLIARLNDPLPRISATLLGVPENGCRIPQSGAASVSQTVIGESSCGT